MPDPKDLEPSRKTDERLEGLGKQPKRIEVMIPVSEIIRRLRKKKEATSEKDSDSDDGSGDPRLERFRCGPCGRTGSDPGGDSVNAAIDRARDGDSADE